jgi:hypothetical protein
MLYPSLDRPGKIYVGRLVPLNVGLEEAEDLINDLACALSSDDQGKVLHFSRFRQLQPPE